MRIELEIPEFSDLDLIIDEDREFELIRIATEVAQEVLAHRSFETTCEWMIDKIIAEEIHLFGFRAHRRSEFDPERELVVHHHQLDEEPTTIPHWLFVKMRDPQTADDVKLDVRRNELDNDGKFESLQVSKQEVATALKIDINGYNLRAKRKPGRKLELFEFWLALAYNAHRGNMLKPEFVMELMKTYDTEGRFGATVATRKKYAEKILGVLDPAAALERRNKK